MIRISVIGGGRASAEERAAAREVGEGIARAGAALVCGGLGGVMESACEGAREAGGLTIGILPGTDAAAANPHVTLPVVTGLGEARNVLIALTADALIAIGGDLGTLTEIGFALKHGRTVVSLHSWGLRERPDLARRLLAATDPAGAVRLALEAARATRG